MADITFCNVVLTFRPVNAVDGPVIWDPCLANAVAAELRERLQGARARAVCLHREAMVARVHFREATVEADLSPRRGTVVVDPAAEPGEGAEPLPAVLAGVEAVPDERVIVMRFRRVRGRKPHPGLILELATNRWNAILAEGPELRVRKRLRVIRSRRLPVGQPWIPPGEGREGRRRDDLDLPAWKALLSDSGEDARSFLLSRVAFLSGLNVGHVLGAPSAEGDLRVEASPDAEGKPRAEASPDAEGSYRRWRRIAGITGVRPRLLILPSGLQPYPWPLRDVEAEPVDSLIAAMRRVREAAATASAEAGDPMANRIAAEVRRLKRKLKHLRRQMAGTERAGELREEGTLLLSSLHLIEAGAAQVTLTGFDGEERTLRLDPLRRPQEHAAALFRRASRLDRAAAELPKRVEATERALAACAELRARHARGDLTAQEGDARLPPSRATGPAPARSRETPAPLPYRVFTSSGGLQIRVGRGARRNDELTFHHSRPADVWLHARHAAGAHVILRWTRPERPPATDLEEAAILAATHSGARGSAHVPVDWTRRKWVRKPRGSRPGAVIPERVQTLFVAPDPSLGKRLAAR